MYMDHVLDMEEWNEDAGFVWLPPTIVFGANVVTVVHPHTLPGSPDPIQDTIVAVYSPLGDRRHLWVVSNREHGNTDYWKS